MQSIIYGFPDTFIKTTFVSSVLLLRIIVHWILNRGSGNQPWSVNQDTQYYWRNGATPKSPIKETSCCILFYFFLSRASKERSNCRDKGRIMGISSFTPNRSYFTRNVTCNERASSRMISRPEIGRKEAGSSRPEATDQTDPKRIKEGNEKSSTVPPTHPSPSPSHFFLSF